MSLAARATSLFKPKTAAVRTGPIGIDIALEAIHLVQLEIAQGDHPRVRARASLPFGSSRKELLESPLEFRSLIKRALAADRFSGRKAVIAIPSGMFRTMSINYQSMSGKDHEDAAIIKAMRERLDGEITDHVLDYMPVRNRSKNDERLALVAVSEKASVIRFLEQVRKAGLDVEALEIGPVAISRLISSLALESGSDNILVVNTGRQASFLTLISGGDLLFDQEVAFGENSLISQTALTLDMPEDMARDLLLRTGVGDTGMHDDGSTDEAGLGKTIAEILKPLFMKLVEEIKRDCLYAAAETRGGSVAQIYLLGSIGRWPGSADLLTSLTGMNVSNIPDPLSLFPVSSDSAELSGKASTSEMVVASGAALRGLVQHG